MGVPKPLYFGKGIHDLQSKAVLGNTSSFNVKALCTSSEKLVKAAVVERDLGDEEKAYTLFFKFVECAQRIKSHPEFRKDEKYFNNMYNLPRNMKMAVENLEALTKSLERRYDEREAMAVAEKLANLNNELESDGRSTPTTSRNGQQPTSKIINVDQAIAESTAKLNGHIEEPKDYLITAKKLASLISEKSTTFFLLDTRSSEDFAASYVKIPTSINVPEDILKPGTTAASVGKNLKIQYRDQWERRANQDIIIICDWTSTDWTPNTAPMVLRDALTKWDQGTKHTNPPFLLEGGFQKFLFAYPHQVSNPKARAPQYYAPRVTNTGPSLADLEYPDLDNGFMVTPSPSPKAVAAQRSGALVITKESPSFAPGLAIVGAALPGIGIARESIASTYPSLSSLASIPSVPTSNVKPVPTVPDRRTKPAEMSSRPRESEGRDEFNEAFGGGGGSLSTVSSTTSLSSSRSSSSTGTLDRAVLEDSVLRPKVDRTKKREALSRYVDKPESIRDLLEVEEEIAETSLRREKEKFDLEERWEVLRQRKEREAEGEMKEMILHEQDKLVVELERLRIEASEKEDNEKKLMGELKAIKEELRKKDEERLRYIAMEEIRRGEKEKEEEARKAEQAREADIRRMEKEKQDLMESVEMKRRERKEREKIREEEKRREEARRRREEGGTPERGLKGLKARLTDEEKKITPDRGRARLKDEGEVDGPRSRMKRSFSSPNIAQMLEQEDKGRPSPVGYSGVPVPKFDRKSKPSLISSRNFAGQWGTQKPGLTGLRNLGNTCYMNSILQCVSNTPPLAHYFISRSYEEDLNEKHSETRGYIAAEFAEVLKTLWSSQFKSISPSDFKAIVGKFKSEFAGRDQQDSHEFVTKLLEWLHGDVNRVQRPSKEPEQNNHDSRDVKAARLHWRNYLERNQSIMVQLFCGQTRSVLRCLSCRAESVTYREFTNLTLPLPETSNRVSLRDCFEELLREETIDEFNCEHCRSARRHTKKIDIVKLPPLLVLHLSRFYQDGLYTRKKQNFVNFDLQGVNVGKFALEGFDNKFSTFNLYAVSNHFGSLEGGHYTAYCNSSVQRRWHKFDDQDVSSIEPGDVVTSAAYILFYSAIEGQTSLPPLG